MLTFYDFNPTPHEIEFVCTMPKEKYLRIKTPDGAYYHIALGFECYLTC